MTMNASVNAPVSMAPAVKKRVWFTGSTALSEGQGVCYNWDKGTASSFDGERMNEVELPSITNARWFAGVAVKSYTANSGGQFIEVNVPGSCCNILSKASTTIGVGRLTCEAGGTYAGYFRYAGFPGEGSAVPLQTVDRSTTAGKCQAYLEVGEASGLVEVVSTNASGGVTGGATTCMVGGVTYLDTDIATSTLATFTLADGTIPGLKKAFVCQATITNDLDVTVTSGVQGAFNNTANTALAGFLLDADLEEITLEWNAFDTNGVWIPTHAVGVTLQSS